MEAPSPWDYFSTMAPEGFVDADRLAVMQALYANPSIVAHMTAAMQARNAGDFDGFRENIKIWTEWFSSFQVAALRSIRDIARTQFANPNLVATNWSDRSGTSFTALDPGGNPVADIATTANYSAPIIYQDIRNLTDDLNKDRHWNHTIGLMNQIRALTDVTKATVWHPYPSYQTSVAESLSTPVCGWLWEQHVRMLIEAGVTDLIYWNPGPAATAAHNQHMANILSDYVGHVFTPITGQPEVALDSASIQMGQRILTYDQFRSIKFGQALRRRRLAA
jgi:hypothetical protein